MRFTRSPVFFVLFAVCFFFTPLIARADTASDQRAALQMQLDQINGEIKQNQATLSQLQTQRTSLERDVAILDSKIQAAQLGIKQL
ncbi:MAG: hypothetical protein KGI71_03040, partial [Patescibacteria group bacterium]|nr:hypothetical protein [Patescibacteria group bacterium]